MRRLVTVLAWMAALVAGPSAARAFDSLVTHPGLTEQAARAARLGKLLERRLGLNGGLWRTLRIRPAALPKRLRWDFLTHLQRAATGQGWTIDRRLGGLALGFLSLGSVLEAVPPRRERNHFLEPGSGRGLSQRHRYPGLARRLGLLFFLQGETSLAALLTGAAFDLTGRPADAWVAAPDNLLGLEAFWTYLERAVTAPEVRFRDHYAAMALLCLGAVAHVLQDMACPSHVHNDFAVAHFLKGSREGSGFEVYVARRYGRYGIGVFKSVQPVSRPTVRAFFRAADRRGLAQWTRRHFASLGSLPKPRRFSPRAAAAAERQLPPHAPIDWTEASRGGTYVLAPDGRTKLAAVEVTAEGVLRFWQDRRVYEDMARRVLPAAVAYTAGLFHHLLRGQLRVRRIRSGLSVEVSGVSVQAGRLVVAADDPSTGLRRILVRTPLKGNRARVSLPEAARGARRLVVVVVGRDTRGERLLVTGWIAGR